MKKIKINQTMSEFQLAQAQKELAKEILGTDRIKNTSRNAIGKINDKLGKAMGVETNKNKNLTSLIKDVDKINNSNKQYEPNTSLWYKIEDNVLYIRGHEAEGYQERVLYTDSTLSKNGWHKASNKAQITKAVIEEVIAPTSCARMFEGMNEMYTIDNFSNIKMDNCKSCFGMFGNCYKLQDLDFSKWNTKNVTNVSAMFNNSTSLQKINLSNWNVKNVEDFSSMFYGYKRTMNIKDIGNLKNWDVSKATKMNSMFCNCKYLKKIDGLHTWNAPKCTSFNYMFAGTGDGADDMYLEYVDVSNLLRNNVVNTSVHTMFQSCIKLKTVGNLSNWNVSNVTDFAYMFSNCKSLETVGDLSNWNAPICNSFKAMFAIGKLSDSVTRLKMLNLTNLLKDNTVCTDTSFMFSGCIDLRSIGDVSQWNTSNVTNMAGMFRSCCSLGCVNGIQNWVTVNLNDANQMFDYAYNVCDANGNSMNKDQYKLELGLTIVPTTISIPAITKNCNIASMFNRQKFIEDIVYCGKISQSFTTKYGAAIQDNMSSLTKESVMKIINALDPENPGTLTLCQPNYEKLTAEDIKVATDKGWIIAQ